MQALTLGVAVVGVLAVLFFSPVVGLAAYFGILLMFPDYLRVSLGSVDVSATRIVSALLLARALLDPRLLHAFRWRRLDSIVTLNYVVGAAALAVTCPMDWWLENRSGFLMDTLLAYFAVRLIVIDRDSLMKLTKPVSLMLVFLAVHGLVETFTGQSLYVGLGAYCPWAPTKGMVYQTRFDLNRAMGPPGETILFGLSFAALVPLVYLLRFDGSAWRKWSVPLALAAVLGVASTVSSGPFLGMIVVLVCLALERFKWLVKPALFMGVVGCFAVEIVSNRHFYHVLGDFTMDSNTAWYRARLIDIALQRLPEYWAFGYGVVDPGWGWEINELKKTDVVNDYIYQAVLYGMGGVLTYIWAQVHCLRVAVRVHNASRSAFPRALAWGLAASLIGLMASSWSVALFGQLTTLYFCLLGVFGSLPSIAVTCESAVSRTASAVARRTSARRPAPATNLPPRARTTVGVTPL